MIMEKTKPSREAVEEFERGVAEERRRRRGKR
jgi:hypothetical protein